MPVYNCERYISEAMDSVLNQTYSHFELLVIDDCSTDKTLEIIESYTDCRIVVVRNKRNCGIISCLNESLKIARGSFIARMDGDDVCERSRLEKQLNFLLENPEVGMVGCNGYLVDKYGETIDIIEKPLDHDSIEFEMLFGCQFIHPAILIRSEIIKKLKYDPEMIHAEDYELWFRVIDQTKVANLSQHLIKIRRHGENTTHKITQKIYDTNMKIFKIFFNAVNLDVTYEDLFIHCSLVLYYWSFYLDSVDKVMRMELWLNKLSTCEALAVLFKSSDIEAKVKRIWREVTLENPNFDGQQQVGLFNSSKTLV